MKNRVENLFLTKIRATFVLSNVGFPTLIDLTNLTREIPCRKARVSSFMYGREPPRARGFPQDCGFCARAAGSAPGLQVFPQCRGFCSGAAGFTPGLRVLLRGCGFYSGAADFTPGLRILLRGCGFLLYNGRRSLHGALPEGKGTQTRFGQGHPAPLPGVGGRTGPLQTGRTGPLPGWRTGRKAPKGRGGRHSPQGAKEKSVFTRKIRYFFLFLHQLGK